MTMNGFRFRTRPQSHRPQTHRRLLPLAALLFVASIGGCSALGGKTAQKSKSPADSLAVSHEPTLWERLTGKKEDEVLVNPLLASQGRAEFEEAEKLLKAGKHDEGEKILKKIIKKYKNAPVREDAQFQLAESQFARKRYSKAQDSYDRLVKDYPSTRYLDRFAKRQFEIAQYWLRSPKIVTGDAIQTVNYEEPKKSEPLKIDRPPTNDLTRKIPILPNLTDRTRPAFDTEGRALEALKSIWMHDPTGPLADDALMLSAGYYLQKEDWNEADRMYTLLRDEYPKSPHVEQAFILGSHVKLMSYQGPAYDSRKLEDSKKLKETTLKLYPKHADRERFLEEIRKIEEALARHDWEMVEYYGRRKRPDAQAIYCRSIMDKYSSTKYADIARQKLAELDRKHAPGRVQVDLDSKPIPPKEPAEYDEKPAKVGL